jgi:hypothetical protein
VDGEKVETGPASGKSAALFLLPERWNGEKQREWEREHGRAASSSVDFPMELTTSAVIKVEHTNRDKDVLAADDVATVVVPPPKTLSVLLVTDGNPYIENAVTALHLKNTATMRPEEYDQKLPGDFDVIVFDRHTPAKLPEAGSFIYFGAVPKGLRGLKADVDAQGRYNLVEDVDVLDWNRDHPVLRNVPLRKLFAARAIRLIGAAENSEVLLDGNKCPLIVLHREGKHVHLICTFDCLDSNWPTLPSFPIFFYYAVQFMSVGANLDVPQSVEPGATPRVPRAALIRGGRELQQVTLKGPAAFGTKTLKVPEAGDFAFPALDYVGVYSTDPALPPFEQIAVNLLDANESNVLPVGDQTKLGGVAEIREGGAGKSRLELWWWIVACAALPLLMIEWWVYTRRVHL